MLVPQVPILIVDTDDAGRRALSERFLRAGQDVVEVSTASEAFEIIDRQGVAMIVADWSFFGSDAVGAFARLRRMVPTVPIVLHSERSDVESQIRGYSLGIDDFWPKPYPMDLALEKTRVLLRRRKMETTLEEPFMLGDVHVELRSRIVIRDGKIYPLSEKEHGILCVLALEKGLPVRRETLLARVWGLDVMSGTRTVDNYIVSLRRKIEADPEDPQFLLTAVGIGYRLVFQGTNASVLVARR